MHLLSKLFAGLTLSSWLIGSSFSQPLGTGKTGSDLKLDQLYLWQGILPFGSERRERLDKQAFSEFEQYFAAMDQWRSNMYGSNEDKPHWYAFRRAIQSYDRDELIESEHRTIDFNGQWLTPSTLCFELNKHSQTAIIDQLGEVSGSVEFRSGSLSNDHIISEFDISVHLGSILFSEFLHSIEAFNGLVAPENVEAVDSSQEKGFVASFHSETKVFDQQLLSLFHKSVPRIMATLSSVSDFEALGEKVFSPSGQAVTRIAHKQRIDLERLEQHFPGTHNDFYDLLNSVSFESAFYTDAGDYVASISYDASNNLFEGDISILNGGFVLRDRAGKLTEELIHPSKLKNLDYTVKSSMHISMFGVDVKVDDLSLDARYKAKEALNNDVNPAYISMQLVSPPQIEVSGAFLYFLPTWLIDLLIPGTIETLIADAFGDLIRGNNGRGFELLFTFNEDQGQHILNIQSTAEMPMDVVQELLKVEDDKEGKEGRLYRTLRMDLRQDFGDKANLVLSD